MPPSSSGLSIFGQGSMPKYHMGAEARVVGVVALFAMLMLAAISFCVRRFSRALYRLGLFVCAFQLLTDTPYSTLLTE